MEHISSFQTWHHPGAGPLTLRPPYAPSYMLFFIFYSQDGFVNRQLLQDEIEERNNSRNRWQTVLFRFVSQTTNERQNTRANSHPAPNIPVCKWVEKNRGSPANGIASSWWRLATWYLIHIWELSPHHFKWFIESCLSTMITFFLSTPTEALDRTQKSHRPCQDGL